MLAPEQSRAARGWLDWTQEDLANRSNVALSTVRDFEKGRRVPVRNNLLAIRHAIEQAGVFLTFDESEPTGIMARVVREIVRPVESAGPHGERKSTRSKT